MLNLANHHGYRITALQMTEPYKGRPKFNATLKRAEGEWLRGLREDREMTQRDVANALGTSPATVSRMENGADHIPRERVAQFAEIFGIDPVDFHKRVLSYRDPWSYVGIFGALPDPALQAELDAERIKYDPEPRAPRRRRSTPPRRR